MPDGPEKTPVTYHGTPTLMYQGLIQSFQASCIFCALDAQGAVSKAAVLTKISCVVLMHTKYRKKTLHEGLVQWIWTEFSRSEGEPR